MSVRPRVRRRREAAGLGHPRHAGRAGAGGAGRAVGAVAPGVGFGRVRVAVHGERRGVSDPVHICAVGGRRGAFRSGFYSLPLFLRSASVREGWFVEQRAQSEAVVRSQPVWSGAGFEYHRIELTGALAIRSLGVPYWFLCACAAMTLFVAWRRRRRARRRPGTCARCGYDLRESRERCPECGTAIPDESGSDNIPVPAKDGVRQS